MTPTPQAKSEEIVQLEQYLAILQQSRIGSMALDVLQPILADLDMKVDKRIYKAMIERAVDPTELVAAWFEKKAIYDLRTKMYKLAAAAKQESAPSLRSIGRGGQST